MIVCLLCCQLFLRNMTVNDFDKILEADIQKHYISYYYHFNDAQSTSKNNMVHVCKQNMNKMCKVPFKRNNVCVCRPTRFEKFTLYLCCSHLCLFFVKNSTVSFSLHFLPYLLYCENRIK